LLFPTPGQYRIVALVYGRLSNQILIKVKPPSDSMKQVLSLLSDPNDWAFLEDSEYRGRTYLTSAMERFRQIVDRFPQTVVAKRAAASLGFEFFNQFYQKNPGLERVLRMRKESKPRDPLLERTMGYLQIAYELPDEYPIRENVLYQLARIYAIDGDFKKAMDLLDELGKKYPNGSYGHGRRIQKVKEELQTLMNR